VNVRQRGQGAAGAGVAARERIVDAFVARARTRGIRGVVMADLARDLGMSKKTVYQHFDTKDALVREIVERWVATRREDARSAAAPLDDAHALVRWWTDLWVKGRTDFCIEFWQDLERDHPEAWRLFQSVLAAGSEIEERIARQLRPDVAARLAGELYFLLVAHFNDPRVCERLGFAPREAVLGALEVWIGGALRPVAERTSPSKAPS
jgi:AcrR family transcriptional regulator